MTTIFPFSDELGCMGGESSDLCKSIIYYAVKRIGLFELSQRFDAMVFEFR